MKTEMQLMLVYDKQPAAPPPPFVLGGRPAAAAAAAAIVIVAVVYPRSISSCPPWGATIF